VLFIATVEDAHGPDGRDAPDAHDANRRAMQLVATRALESLRAAT